MKKKYKYVMVNNLTYLKTDEDGNDDGKIYQYNGDHSSFCDGILPDDLDSFAIDIDFSNSSTISPFPTTSDSKPHANLRRCS